MTDPIYTYHRWSLEQECASLDVEIPTTLRACDEECGRWRSVSELFDTRDSSVVEGDWVCFACASKADRAETAIAEQSARPLPTWDTAEGCEQAKFIRAERSRKLLESDWTVSATSPLDEMLQAQWANYRQELRDISAAFSDPTCVVWPTSPQGST